MQRATSKNPLGYMYDLDDNDGVARKCGAASEIAGIGEVQVQVQVQRGDAVWLYGNVLQRKMYGGAVAS